MTRTIVRAAVASIACEELGLRTLDLRGRDDLDSHDLHVGRIERALTRAYHAGGTAAGERLFRTDNHAQTEGDPS